MEFYVFNVVENTGKIFVPTEHGKLCERIDRKGGSFEQISDVSHDLSKFPDIYVKLINPWNRIEYAGIQDLDNLFQMVEKTLAEEENETEQRKKLVEFRYTDSQQCETSELTYQAITMTFKNEELSGTQKWEKYRTVDGIFAKENSEAGNVLEYNGQDLLKDAQKAVEEHKQFMEENDITWKCGEAIEVHGQGDMICVKFQNGSWQHYKITDAGSEWLGF